MLTVEKGNDSKMNSHPLSGEYLSWLAPQIRGEGDGHPSRSYDDLLEIMHEKQFIERVPHDNNRIGDGLDLRIEFGRETGLLLESSVGSFLDKRAPIPACSFLEVLIALSRRLAFAAGGKDAPGWAWVLMFNLELHRITDPVGRAKAQRADDILDRCIWRNYAFNGEGGFFPLERPIEDQTQVEIWYQMAAYIRELYREEDGRERSFEAS